MSSADEVQIVARDLMVALAGADIDAALGGAMAYGYWGVPRGTLDVDVTVFVDPEHLDPVLALLAGLGARFERDRALDLARRRGVFDVALRGIRVDVYVPDIPLYDSARGRRRRVRFMDVEVPVWAPEDIALFKLLYFRPKDKVDVETLVRVQSDALDLSYIRGWLTELVGTADERSVWFESVVRNLT